MSGGKSSSSTTQTQETSSVSSDGFVGGDLYQGKQLTINNAFSQPVQDAFDSLIGLAGQSLELAGQAGQRALDLSSSAVSTVADTSNFQSNPDSQTISRLIPVFMLIVAGASIYFVMRK